MNEEEFQMDAASQMKNSEVGEAALDNKITLLAFELVGEHCGLEAKFVQTIVHVPPRITRVPNAPFHVSGVINLRGTVVPVLDCAAKMGMGVTQTTPDTRVVVAEVEGIQFGFFVDAVREVREISEAIIEPGHVDTSGFNIEYIDGVAKMDDGRLVVLLDLVSLFDIKELLEEDV